MTDDYKFQLSATVNGNLLNVRANSAAELRQNIAELATEMNDLLNAYGQVKQSIVAKDIFTGNTPSPAAQKAGTARASGGGPKLNEQGQPVCAHGVMKDLTDLANEKNYKASHYCPEKDRDKQCKAVDMR